MQAGQQTLERTAASRQATWSVAAPALRIIYACLAFAPVAFASSPRAAVDQYIAVEMRTQEIPGLSLAVLRHGRPVYLRSYGVASLEHAVPVTAQTLFQIGSIGKQFTATLVMQLAREHVVELDDRLSKYLPEIPPGWSTVTLRLMLNHQSGIPQLTPPDRALLDLHHDYSDDEYVRLAATLPLDFEPGTDAEYSDTAYVLLGIVIKRATGRFYGDLLAERVFRPLSMTRTRILSDADIIPGRASGYEKNASGALKNQAWVAAALNRTADGSLYSTTLDLARWDQALTSDRVLSESERARMWSVDANRGGQRPLYHYGYGWEINSLRGQKVIEYDGNWQGFQAAMAKYPDRNLTVVVLTNLALCRAQRIAHTVAGLIDPTLAHFRLARHDAHPDLTRAFADFIEGAAMGTAAQTSIGPAVASVLGPVWVSALARDLRVTGPVERVTLAEESVAPRFLERVYRVEMREMVDFFTVRYGEGPAINDIALYHEY